MAIFSTGNKKIKLNKNLIIMLMAIGGVFLVWFLNNGRDGQIEFLKGKIDGLMIERGSLQNEINSLTTKLEE